MMATEGQGSIVVTGNTAALRGKPSYVGWAPTKTAQRILAEALARELGPQGVHVAYVIIDAAIDMALRADADKIGRMRISLSPMIWHQRSTVYSLNRRGHSWWNFDPSRKPGEGKTARPGPMPGLLKVVRCLFLGRFCA